MGIRLPPWFTWAGFAWAYCFAAFLVISSTLSGTWGIISHCGGYCFSSAYSESWVAYLLVIGMLASMVQISGWYLLFCCWSTTHCIKLLYQLHMG
ncbi:hypothetical protein BC828DRAFT_375307 [Blastocladiella britannica]|nr:hypothetical protein BC828DRAFT_375307 [Blastocladiella britannica]